MKIVPSQPDPSWNAGRASRLVAEVRPVARPREAASSEERAGQAASSPPLDRVQRESLMAQRTVHSADPWAESGEPGGRERRALHAYGEIATLEQRQSLDEMLRFRAKA